MVTSVPAALESHLDKPMPGRLPNLFIIGYPKCGTTSLFTYLCSHPDFCGSSKKEPSYFFRKRFRTDEYDLIEYQKYFEKCGNQRFVLEASVTHARGGRAHARFLWETFEQPYVVVMLREPTIRLYSYYHLCKDNGYIDAAMTFGQFIDEGKRRAATGAPLSESIWRSYAMRYADHLFEWLDVFGDNMFIGFFEDMKRDPEAFCDAVCAWLGVPPMSAFNVTFEVENKTISPRSDRLHRLARRLNKTTEPLLRRNLSLKRALRAGYWRANARKGGPGGPTPAEQQRLDEMFAASNARLREALLARRPDLRLPAWLAEAGTL